MLSLMRVRQQPNLAIIWVADGEVVPGLDYGVRLEQQLRSRGMAVMMRSSLAADTEVPDAAHHFLTGGATSATQREGWMPTALNRVRIMLRQAAAETSTVTGICLGAQMIAEAQWPGSVRRGSSIEVGFTHIVWSDHDGDRSFVVPAFHYEEIDPAPVVSGGGSIRASNAHSRVQAFEIGPRVRGMQFHPELGPDDMRRLVVAHHETIEAHSGSVAEAERSIDRFADTWQRQIFEPLFDHL